MEKGLINWLNEENRAFLFGFRFALLGVFFLILSAYFGYVGEKDMANAYDDYNAGDITAEGFWLRDSGLALEMRNSNLFEKLGFASVFLGISLLIMSRR